MDFSENLAKSLQIDIQAFKLGCRWLSLTTKVKFLIFSIPQYRLVDLSQLPSFWQVLYFSLDQIFLILWFASQAVADGFAF